MYLIYSLLLVLTAVVGSPWFAWQALRHRKYVGSVRERLGRLPVSLNLDGEPSIWVHAVSVGEVLAARPLVESLKVRYPGLRLFVSTTTMAGQRAVARRSATRSMSADDGRSFGAAGTAPRLSGFAHCASMASIEAHT